MGRKAAIIVIAVFAFLVGGTLLSCASRTEDTAEWYTQQCYRMCAQGYYDDAIKACTWAIKLDPNLCAAYRNRGWAYCRKGNLDLAIADCTKAIDLNPNEVIAYKNRAWAHCEKGHYNLAIADCEKVIELSTDPGLSQEARETINEIRAYILDKPRYTVSIILLT